MAGLACRGFDVKTIFPIVVFVVLGGCTQTYEYHGSCSSPRTIALGGQEAASPLFEGAHTAAVNGMTAAAGLPDEAKYKRERKIVEAGATDRHGQFRKDVAVCGKTHSTATWKPRPLQFLFGDVPRKRRDKD